ncbi:hypothetical protein ACQKFK_20585, partial [Bacillus mycoides]
FFLLLKYFLFHVFEWKTCIWYAFFLTKLSSYDEIKTFGDEIIKEYTNKTYIKDVSNHEYMLKNIFKSEVVERNASEKPLKDFAFDFWQNSKYNYRGVENTTSSATQENERQMDKALSKMKK